MANQRRSVSWFSLSSVRRPATAPPPAPTPTAPARSDSIRPPTFKPFRTLSSASSASASQPQKPTWPPTAIGTAAPVQRAQTPQPAPVQRPLFRSATAAAPISQQPAVTFPPAAAQRSSPLPTLTITSSALSNAKPPTTTTAPSLAKSIPTSPEIKFPPAAPVTANVALYFPNNNPNNMPPSSVIISDRVLVPTAAAETEHKSPLLQQLTENSNLVPPNYTTPSNVDTEHHKLQTTAQIAKTGVALFQDKAVAMQRKYLESKKFGLRIVRLVGDNIGAAMVLSSSRNKYDYEAKPLSIQDKRSRPHSKEVNSKEEAAAAEGRSNRNKEQSRLKTLQPETSTSTLFMNSNVQGVNNSIAFDSRLTHHDPGLHVCTFEP